MNRDGDYCDTSIHVPMSIVYKKHVHTYRKQLLLCICHHKTGTWQQVHDFLLVNTMQVVMAIL
jgi:hypothetical protein